MIAVFLNILIFKKELYNEIRVLPKSISAFQHIILESILYLLFAFVAKEPQVCFKFHFGPFRISHFFLDPKAIKCLSLVFSYKINR